MVLVRDRAGAQHSQSPVKAMVGTAMNQFTILQCAALLNIAQLRGDG
jgi:hypothetical protein